MSNSTDDLLARLVLEALPFGLYVVDREGKIILWSEGAEKLTGYLRQNVVGRSCKDQIPQSGGEDHLLVGAVAPLLATLRNGRAASGEISLPTKSGHFLPVRVQTLPVRDERARLLGAVELFEPLTAQPQDDRRQHKLGAFGCVDPLTGALNHSMIQARLTFCAWSSSASSRARHRA